MQACMPNKQNNGAQHQQEHKRRKTTTKSQLIGFNAFIITVISLMSVCESVLQPVHRLRFFILKHCFSVFRFSVVKKMSLSINVRQIPHSFFVWSGMNVTSNSNRTLCVTSRDTQVTAATLTITSSNPADANVVHD